MLVLDASVALEILLKTPLGVRCANHVLKAGESLHAPHLLDVEFAHVLRRLTLTGELQAADAQQALDGLQELPLIRHAHTALLQRMWMLRKSVSAYDAAYLALAEGLAAALFTCDTKLSRAHGHRAEIVLLK
jgi:predicted nucleic acid-binding protein